MDRVLEKKGRALNPSGYFICPLCDEEFELDREPEKDSKCEDCGVPLEELEEDEETMMPTNGGTRPIRGSATPNQLATMTTLLTEQGDRHLAQGLEEIGARLEISRRRPSVRQGGSLCKISARRSQAFVLAALRNSTSDPGPAPATPREAAC